MVEQTEPKPETYNGNIDQLPAALEHLRDQKVWVNWKWIFDGNKWTKPPYRTDNTKFHAATSDPCTWGFYNDAVNQVFSGNADGIGFAVKGRDIGGIDLDHCRDPMTGEIQPWAQERLKQFPTAYHEATVSGTGLRILGVSSIEDFAPKFRKLPYGNGAAIELFSNSNHYLTLSCNELTACTTLPPIGVQMKALAGELDALRQNGAADGHADGHADTDNSGNDADHKATPWSLAQDARIRSALGAVPADEAQLNEKLGHSHDAFVKIGRALERTDWGERGYAIWRDWCSQLPAKFDEHGLRGQWRSFTSNRNSSGKPVTLGTIYYFAKQFGWSSAQTNSAGPVDLPEPVDLPPLPFINMSNWDNEPVPDQEWTVENWIPKYECCLTTGQGGAGKSMTALHLCSAHVLAGREWLKAQTEPGPAIFFDAEDDIGVMHRRLASICRHYNVRFEDLIRGGLQLLSFAGKDAVLATPTRSGKIEPTPLYHQLMQACGDIKPRMLTIASTSNVFVGSELDRTQVQQFVSLMVRLGKLARGSVMLIAHPSLTGINSGSGLSGTTQWHNAVRARIYLKGVEGEPDDDLREITFQKNQYGKLGESIVLQYRDGMFLPLPTISTLDRVALEAKTDELFLTLLSRFDGRGMKISAKKMANNYAPKAFAETSEAKATKIKPDDFAKAMERLFDAKKIHVETYGPTSKERECIVKGPAPMKPTPEPDPVADDTN